MSKGWDDGDDEDEQEEEKKTEKGKNWLYGSKKGPAEKVTERAKL